MRLLNKITADSSQKFNILGENGEQISFSIYYMASQQSWFFNLTSEDKTLNGIKLTVSPNMLHNYKNVFSFGLACITSDGMEPLYIDDFSTQRIRLYLLSAADVAAVEEQIFGE